MFKGWFSKQGSVENDNKNSATKRLQSYITQVEVEEEEEDIPNEESSRTSHLVSPVLIGQRNKILNESQKAISKAEKQISEQPKKSLFEVETYDIQEKKKENERTQKEEPQYIPELTEEQHKQPLPSFPTDDKESEEIDYLNADLPTLLKNMEEDPFADTEELLDKSEGKKYVEVTVVYDAENTIEERTYTFETKSFTSFHENWSKEIYMSGTYMQEDIHGRIITINPSKCYTVEIVERRY